MDMILEPSSSSSEDRQIIYESPLEIVSLIKKGPDYCTERQLKADKSDHDLLFKTQIEFFDNIRKDNAFPRLFPNFFDWEKKNTHFLYFEPVSLNFQIFIENCKKENHFLTFKEILIYFKTILHGFCFMQLLDYETNEIKLNDLYINKEKDIKLLNFEKNKEKKGLSECSNFAKIVLSIFTLNLEINYSEEGFFEEITKIQSIYGNKLKDDDAFYYKKILKFLKKSYNNSDKPAKLFNLFKKLIQTQNKITLKKIILLEDDFKSENNFELVKGIKPLKKETFEIINLEQKVKIYGFASEQFFRDFKSENEIPGFLQMIKPIHSLNICTTRGDPESDKDKSFFSNALDSSLFEKPFKTVLIQSSMGHSLVGSDHWLQYFWRVFYKRAQEAIEDGGIKFLHEHDTYWDYGVTDEQVDEILSVLKYPFINSEFLEDITIYLQSWWTMTHESVISLTKVVRQLKFKNIKSFNIGVEIRNLENRNILVDLLCAIYETLKGKDENLESFSFYVYSNFTQDEIMINLCKLLHEKKCIEKFNLFISSISSKAPFDEFFNTLDDKFIGNLNTLSLGFDSWVLGSSYVDDTILTTIWHKLKNSISSKMKNFSFFILTLGIVEETLDLMWNTMAIADFALNTCNIYFVGYFHQKGNSEHFKKKLEASLKKNNHDINIGAFYFDFWK